MTYYFVSWRYSFFIWARTPVYMTLLFPACLCRENC